MDPSLPCQFMFDIRPVTSLLNMPTKESVNGRGKRKAAEVIDIDDDDEKTSEESGKVEEMSAASKEKLQERAERALRNVLKPLYEVIEEKIDITSSSKRNINVEEAPLNEDDVFEELDNLTKQFANIKLPDDFLQDLVEEFYPSLAELSEPPAKTDKPKKPVRKEKARPSITQAPSSFNPSSSSVEIRFYCPLSCNFFTTKQGMEKGDAAKHLQRVHKVTGQIMEKAKSGTYRFRKVKQETRVETLD